MNRRARVLAFAFLGAFWVLSIASLDRFPAVIADEPWIVSPGYKLFTQGVYGSDMFTGFFGMDRHYLQFPPLMSVAQGAVARAVGIGVFQMRYLPVVCGLLILALAFQLGTLLGNAWTGTVALGLLFFGNGRRAETAPCSAACRCLIYRVWLATTFWPRCSYWQPSHPRSNSVQLSRLVASSGGHCR